MLRRGKLNVFNNVDATCLNMHCFSVEIAKCQKENYANRTGHTEKINFFSSKHAMCVVTAKIVVRAAKFH